MNYAKIEILLTALSFLPAPLQGPLIVLALLSSLLDFLLTEWIDHKD